MNNRVSPFFVISRLRSESLLLGNYFKNLKGPVCNF